MKQLYKIMVLFLLLAVAGGQVGYGQDSAITVIDTTVCESFTWNNVSYTSSTAFTDTLENVAGGDSVVEFHFTVNMGTHNVFSKDTCDSYTWNGQTYDSSGVYYFEYNNGSCPSADTLHLTIRKPTTYTDVHDTCGSFTWIDGNTYTSSTDTPTFTLTNTAGCDSVVTLHLTINNPVHSSTTIDTCESYTWTDGDGLTYTTSGNYTYSHQDANGCTQVDTLHLIIHHGTHTSQTASACGSYVWHGTVCDTTGTYTYPYWNNDGCPSVDTLHLSVNYSDTTTLTAAICDGENYNFLGQNIGSSRYSVGTNTFTHTLYTSKGCDSVITLILTVHPLPNVTISGDTVVCAGQQTTLTATYSTQYHYQWNTSPGDTIDSVTVGVGNYTVTVTDANGCSNTASSKVTGRMQFSAGSIASGDTAVCFGSAGSVLIGNSTSAAGGDGQIAYRWKRNDTVVTNANDILSVNIGDLAAVTYRYTREAKDNTCNTGWTASGGQYKITVHQKPTLSLISVDSAQAICYGNSISPVYYRFGGGALSASVSGLPAGVSATLTHDTLYLSGTPSQNGYSSHYTVITVSGNVCQASNRSGTITVWPLPTVTISGKDSFCDGGNSTLTASGASSYVWNTNDYRQSPSITVNTAGTYSVTGTDTNNCSNTATKTVIVTPLPNVTIAGESSFCKGDYATLTATGASSYVWSNGNQNASITVNTVNAGSSTYTVTGTANGCANTATKMVTVNPTYNTPIAAAICQGENYDFFGQTLTTAGQYSHTLHTSKGCDSVITLNLIVNPLPNVTITGNSSFCQGDNLTLTAEGASTYAWSNGASGNETTVFYAGTYTVTGTDTNNCRNSDTLTVSTHPTYNVAITDTICADALPYHYVNGVIDTTFAVGTPGFSLSTFHLSSKHSCDSAITLSLIVKPLPTPHIDGPSAICQNDTATLMVYGGYSYEWENGTTQNSINVTQGGTYTVTATSEEGCSATANFTLTVNPLPPVTITGNSSFCQGTSTILTASGASTYAWSNGTTGSTTTVSTAGTYTVTGTDTHSCRNSDTLTVSTNPTYNVAITDTICADELPYHYINGEIDTTFAVGTPGFSLSTFHLSSQHFCDSIITLTLIVHPLPTPTIQGDNEICAGDISTITATGGDNYEWSTSENTNSINVDSVSTYTVTAYNTFGCSATANFTLTVHQLPDVSIGGHNHFCQDTSTTLNASGASTYVWSNGATGTSTTVNTAGTYTVTGTDINGCTATAEFLVTVDTLPVITISGENEFCFGSSTALTASGADTYIWNTGAGTSNITVTDGGIYSVTGTNSYHCRGTASVMTFVKPLPTPFILGDSSICYDETATLTATGGDSYQWTSNINPGDIIATTSSVTVAVGGTYTVTVTDAYGCSNTAEFTVNIAASPLERKDLVIKKHADGTPYMLVYPEPGLQYQWYQNDAVIQNATMQYFYPGDYNLGASLEMGACYKVKVEPANSDLCGIESDTCITSAPQSSKLRILPNPNNGRFRLLLPEETVSVQILNANGQTVLARKTDGAAELDMSTGLANGLYFVKTFLKDGSYNTEKLIINR